MTQNNKHEWDLVSSRVRTKKKKGEKKYKMLICGVKSHLSREFLMKIFLKEGCINVDFKQILLCGWKEKKKQKEKKLGNFKSLLLT